MSTFARGCVSAVPLLHHTRIMYVNNTPVTGALALRDSRHPPFYPEAKRCAKLRKIDLYKVLAIQLIINEFFNFNFIMIISLLIIPLIGVLLLLPFETQETQDAQEIYKSGVIAPANAFKSDSTKNLESLLSGYKRSALNNQELMKKIALFISLINLIISIYM